MENRKWLPADTRARLIDLCKDRNISQAQLAEVIGIDRSAMSRFLSGKTDSLSHEHVIKIAKYFNVSTDFLLGETDDPSRINYDIGELGLTVKAAECLYTRKVDPVILCKLLEQERCGDLMREIGFYLDETMASGIAAQNQLYNSLTNLLSEHVAGHPEDKEAAVATAQTVQAMKQPLYTERDRIHSDFDHMLLNIKKDSPSNAKQAALLTQDTMRNLTDQMKKGDNCFNLHNISLEIINGVLGQMAMIDVPESIKPEMDGVLARLREDVIAYFNLLQIAREQDK